MQKIERIFLHQQATELTEAELRYITGGVDEEEYATSNSANSCTSCNDTDCGSDD